MEFLQLLDWIRQDKTEWDHGYTAGFIGGARSRLDPVEMRYLENIRLARYRGVSA